MPEGVEVKYYKKTISTTDGKSYEFVLPVVKSPGIVAEVDAHGTQTYTYGYTEDNWESMDAIKTVLGIDTTMVKLPFLVDITRFSGEDNQQTAMKAYSKLYEYFPNLEKITNFDSDSVSFDILPSNPGMTFKNLTNRLSAGGSDTSLSYVNAYPVVRVSVHPFYIRNRYNLNFVLVGEFTETYTNVHQIKIACDPDTPNSTIVFYSKSTPLATGLNNFLKGAEEVEPGPEPGGGDDPYNPGGTSGGGGGQGSLTQRIAAL